MQSKIRSINGPLHAKICLPGSKSITQRALLLAALADGVSELSDLHLGQHTLALINALRQAGVVIQLDPASHSCIVAGCNGQFPKKQATIWCADTKIIASFLIAACSATAGVYYFDGKKRAREFALTELLHVLSCQKVQFIPNDVNTLPFTLIGSDTLEGGDFVFNAETKSQIISALLMIAPYARSAFTFNLHESANTYFIDMTSSMMAEFGVLTHRIHQSQFMVPVPQRYQAKDYLIEPDFSLAAYFFAAAAITHGEVSIQPTKRASSKQKDVKFLSILEKMGCQIFETHSSFSVNAMKPLQGVEVSMRDYADTCVALAIIAPFATTPTRISHIGKTSPQETQRMLYLKTELEKTGVRVESNADSIIIYPGVPQACTINTHADPLIAMAFSVMGLKVPGLCIDDVDCIKKSYTEFFNLWNKMLRAEESKVQA